MPGASSRLAAGASASLERLLAGHLVPCVGCRWGSGCTWAKGSSMADTQIPAGWYRDPAGSDGWRWWDGAAWTDVVRGPEPDPAPATTVPPSGRSPSSSAAAAPVEPRPGGRSRRPLMLGLVVAVPIMVVVGVGVALITSGTEGTAEDGWLPDLAEEPEVAWTYETVGLLEDLLEDISRSAAGASDQEWVQSTVADIRAGGRKELVSRGWMSTWGAASGVLVAQPTFEPEFTGRLYGIEVATGERIWTADDLQVSARDFHRCDAAGQGGGLYCMSYTYGPAFDLESSVLRRFSPDDGSVLAERDLARSDGNVELAIVDDDGVVIRSWRDATGDTTIELQRLDYGLEEVWSTTVQQSFESGVTEVGSYLVVSSYGPDAPAPSVLSAADGEDRPELRADGAGVADVSYIDHAGQLIRESGSSTGGSDVSTFEGLETDGEIRWSLTSEDGLLSGHADAPDAPILLSDDDGRTISGVDPDDGSVRWTHRVGVGRARVMIQRSDVVVIGDEHDIVALEGGSGEELWRTNVPSSEARYRHFQGGRTLYIQYDDRLEAYNLDDGERRWSWSMGSSAAPVNLTEVGGELVLVQRDRIRGLE